MAAERRVRGAGLSLSVTERGVGARPTVLLLHGFPDTSAVWDPVAELLCSDLHIVSYDVRGAGRSDTPAETAGYALPLLMEDLEAVVDATSPDAPVHLVAHDWGSIQGWEAVTTPHLAHRLASFTSLSGPPLEHAGRWARQRLSLRPNDLRDLFRQGMHSWYIAYFHLPVLPEMLTPRRRATSLWAARLHRAEHVATDENWPAPTFGADFAHGIELYRANVRGRVRRSEPGHTEVPVQLVVATQDRYVTPALLDGLEEWTSLMWRRPLEAGHWAIRTRPDEVARYVRDVVAFVEDGMETEDLRRWRVGLTRPAA